MKSHHRLREVFTAQPRSAARDTCERHFVADNEQIKKLAVFNDRDGKFGRVLRSNVVRLVNRELIPAGFWIPDGAVLNQRSVGNWNINAMIFEPYCGVHAVTVIFEYALNVGR